MPDDDALVDHLDDRPSFPRFLFRMSRSTGGFPLKNFSKSDGSLILSLSQFHLKINQKTHIVKFRNVGTTGCPKNNEAGLILNGDHMEARPA